MLVRLILAFGSLAVWVPSMLAGDAKLSNRRTDLGRVGTAVGVLLFVIAMALASDTTDITDFFLGVFVLLRASALPMAVALQRQQAAALLSSAAIAAGLITAVTMETIAPGVLIALTVGACLVEQHPLLSTLQSGS
jgi:hypothetical protein